MSVFLKFPTTAPGVAGLQAACITQALLTAFAGTVAGLEAAAWTAGAVVLLLTIGRLDNTSGV